MAGRTGSEVVIAVDSAITESGRVIINEHRKLINIGESGACAISGFLGGPRTGDFSVRARAWLKKNARLTGLDALAGFLRVAADSWNGEHYQFGQMPRDRQAGNDITTIVCGDMVDGTPALLEAYTRVAPDGSAIRFGPLRLVGSFEFSGYFDWPSLLGLPNNDSAPKNATKEMRVNYPFVRKDILDNRSAVEVISALAAEQDRTTRIYEGSHGKPIFPMSRLDRAQLQILFGAVFKSVETYEGGVAPPNSVRLISKCGRFNSTVESTWVNCKSLKSFPATTPKPKGPLPSQPRPKA